MSQLINRLIIQNKGSIAVEFAIIIPFMIFLFLFVFEMSRLMLIGSSLDLLSAELSRKTAITEDILTSNLNHSDVFYDHLSMDNPWWVSLTSEDNFTVTVEFCDSIDQVIDGSCNAILSETSTIIFFKLVYKYPEVLSIIFDQLTDASLNKNVIVYREFYS